LYFYILISRIDPERHPFFDDNRLDYIEAYLEGRESRRRMAQRFKSKMMDELREDEERIEELERELHRAKRDADLYEKVKSIMRDSGVTTTYGWEERLKARLEAGVSADMRLEVGKVKQAVERLASMIG
jgi:septal ring factor EnvC (AmiA/AmiB activator)